MSRANTQCVNQGSFCHFFSVIVQGEGPLSYRLMKTMRPVIKLLTALITPFETVRHYTCTVPKP